MNLGQCKNCGEEGVWVSRLEKNNKVYYVEECEECGHYEKHYIGPKKSYTSTKN